MCRRLAEIDPERDAAPIPNGIFVRLSREMLGISKDYSTIKHTYNSLIMNSIDTLHIQIKQSSDPLMTAIQLSIAGNYVDFDVLKDVNESQLLKLLKEAADKPIDSAEYSHLKDDLSLGGEVVFIHDNCGEIVLDRLLIETLLTLYPDIHICSVVRGGPIANDATIEDANEIGLTEMVEVIDNGLENMGGTPLHLIPESLLKRINNASLVIAKGQGNFETMSESGLNVYFLFLAKCEYYTRWYGLKRFSSVLANNLRMKF